MKQDKILSVEIDDSGRLLIKPQTEKFNGIYKTASEVNWDNSNSVLYSPKPREWSYLDWYNHILKIVDEECSCKLSITSMTTWVNIPDELKNQIKQQNNNVT
jgi:hypothetical protein